MTERELLTDCLQRLNRSGVAYLLTGSMASNYWGIPRSTHDLDFVVQLAPEDLPDFVRAFSGEFFLQESAIRAAFQPPHQFNAVDTRSALKVDFWILRDELFEQIMFQRRKQVALFEIPAWIGTAEDVVLHKLYWNKLSPSDRQIGDAAGVIAVQAGTLDEPYMRHWASQLGVMTELEDLLSGRAGPKSS
jgi:hypothetical protein